MNRRNLLGVLLFLSIATGACAGPKYARSDAPPPPPPPHSTTPKDIPTIPAPVVPPKWVCDPSATVVHLPSFGPPVREPPVPEKSEASLQSEVQQLTTMLKSFEPSDANWLSIARRLAETLRNAEVAAARTTHAKQAAMDVYGYLEAHARYESLRADSLKIHLAIVDARPYDAGADDDLAALADDYADRAIFSAAEEQTARGERSSASGYWIKLDNLFPKSRYTPIGYRSLGDELFEYAAVGEASWGLARFDYEEALARSAAVGVTHEEAYVNARLAYIAWNEGKNDEAKARFKKALAIATEDGMSADGEEVVADAKCALGAL